MGLRTNFEACDTNSQTLVFGKSRLGVFFHWHLGGFIEDQRLLSASWQLQCYYYGICCPVPSNVNDMHITSHLIRSRKYFLVPRPQPPAVTTATPLLSFRIHELRGARRGFEVKCMCQADGVVMQHKNRHSVSAECTMCAYNYHEQSFILQRDSFSHSAQRRHGQVTEILSN